MAAAVPASAAPRFWVNGAGGEFNDSANWSTTSGGAGGASVPGVGDNALLDRPSGTISFTVNPSGTVTFTDGPNNLSVTGSGSTFTVTSLNNTRGNFTLTFNTPCGSQSVSLSVTN